MAIIDDHGPGPPSPGQSPEPDPGRGAPLPKRWASRLQEPYVLFPLIAVLLLATIWGTTLTLVRSDRDAAERIAVASSRELAETYEAQVVRVLREIDQTLKLVQYAGERGRIDTILGSMKAGGLLPPELLFVVDIADASGNVIASTRPSRAPVIVDKDFLELQRRTDGLFIGAPQRVRGSDEWTLRFSRRLATSDGRFSGVVIVSVDASFFVSGYEASKLGADGVLGVVGTDGVFLVRRSGETVSAGDRVDYAALVPSADTTQREGASWTTPWDGVLRYTTARPLYDFPLAVVVGLSAREQLAPASRDMRLHLLEGAGGSLIVIAILAMLGRMSWQLASARKRAAHEQVLHAARVEFIAYHDELTQLPNRVMFSRILGRNIAIARRHERQFAVLFMDVDRFKEINDSLGHEAGDQLLREVAKRLRLCVGDGDTVARLGGDEFVALLPELDENRQYVIAVAQKMLVAVAQPFIVFGQEVRVTASIGISLFPEHGLDEGALKKNADVAMYKAKAEGKNNFQFYSDALNDNALERLTFETDLRHGLERNEFELAYQTRRDTRTGRITGVEALLRWQHPDLGMIAPLRFIPVANETGLIVPIGKWVLRRACQQNMAWQRDGLPPLCLAINLTERQFYDDSLLADLAAAFEASGMDAHRLELEISESVLMRDMGKSLQILTRLRDLRVRIAIDDFGIGYASLSTLRKFPLDTVKIDRSLVRDIGQSIEGDQMTEAMIAAGKALSLTVVAQGVETEAQADFMRRTACDELQGFSLDKPLPPDRIGALLREERNRLRDDARSDGAIALQD